MVDLNIVLSQAPNKGQVVEWVSAIISLSLFILGFLSLRSDRRRLTKLEQTQKAIVGESVHGWVEEQLLTKSVVVIRNGSQSAIYEVTVWLVDSAGKQSGNKYRIDIMKPLEERSCAVETPDSKDIRLGAVFTFRDPAGNCWKRNPDGILEEVPPA